MKKGGLDGRLIKTSACHAPKCLSNPFDCSLGGRTDPTVDSGDGDDVQPFGLLTALFAP